ncbi:tRNA pseudouridine(55) synthase TruB [Marinospirillum sp.]|uniref:tRNA pseudouridine(55) synthase TruB n=1 Tax=Marinospirillum sp. TaxID=2183934 RepID=UPI0028707637|nr:tRNA pseudouridine(55) synthase TruB [Marinospirillum sp.]MDR9467408.1 tRNA pseudouridine(55) synthase TruB [Marinospirillum sp.]
MQRKTPRHRVDGVLLLDKPLGWSSNRALQKVRWLLKAKKGGHTGNLDPLASGVLPLCFGDATKFAQFGLEADKAYVTRIQLGEQRNTGDAEGAVVATAALPQLTEEKILKQLEAFRGEQEQVPPMYSALKHQGKKLYELAREGKEIERKPRRIFLSQLKLLDWGADFLEIQVHCSKGTYIRVLGEDLALALGSLGYLASLRRIQSGPFAEDQLVSLAELEEIWEAEGELALEATLHPVDLLLEHLPSYALNQEQTYALTHGQSARILDSSLGIGENVRLYSPEQQFIGLGEVRSASESTLEMAPKKMCSSG